MIVLRHICGSAIRVNMRAFFCNASAMKTCMPGAGIPLSAEPELCAVARRQH